MGEDVDDLIALCLYAIAVTTGGPSCQAHQPSSARSSTRSEGVPLREDGDIQARRLSGHSDV